MKLSIIIVNYNTYSLTKQTIESVLEGNQTFSYEILLVDNASSDGSIEALEQDYKNNQSIIIIKNTDNLGFSKANNIGIRRASGEYILLLNSDTVVDKDCLQKSIEYIEEDTNIGMLGVKVVLPTGKLDPACKRGFPTPRASLYYFIKLHRLNPRKYGAYNASHIDEDEVSEIDCLMGAYMLMPRRVLDQVGLLDEDFFMYGEDIDLCYRIHKAGYKNIYYPKTGITHYKGGSSKKRRTKIIYDFHNAMWLFYKKHYIHEYAKVTTALVYMGIWTKYILELTKNALKKQNTKVSPDINTGTDISG